MKEGAEVTLIHGHVTEDLPKGAQAVKALTNEAMAKALQERFSEADALVMAGSGV